MPGKRRRQQNGKQAGRCLYFLQAGALPPRPAPVKALLRAQGCLSVRLALSLLLSPQHPHPASVPPCGLALLSSFWDDSSARLSLSGAPLQPLFSLCPAGVLLSWPPLLLPTPGSSPCLFWAPPSVHDLAPRLPPPSLLPCPSSHLPSASWLVQTHLTERWPQHSGLPLPPQHLLSRRPASQGLR